MGNDSINKLELLEFSSLVRGIVINELIDIERLIDDFIAQHYCGITKDSIDEKRQERRKEFLHYVISQDGISFDRKRQIFENLLKKNYPETYARQKKPIRLIEKVISERNILAHHLLDRTPAAKAHFISTREFKLLRFKNGEDPQLFDSARLKVILSNTGEIKAMLNSLG